MEIISYSNLTEEQIKELCNLLYHYRILYIKHKDYIEIYSLFYLIRKVSKIPIKYIYLVL